MNSYDLIVIGSGSAGSNVMHRATGKGWKVAFIESGHLGGSCINVGCIPSKALIQSARTMRQVQGADRFGVVVGAPKADWAAMTRRKDRIVARMRAGGYNGVAENKNVTLLEGKASFSGPQAVSVNGETINADKIVIATGARPLVPAIPGLDQIDYLTSTTVMELEQLPKSMIVIGGGLIALEFSQFFTRLGVEVTVLQRNVQLAPQLERDIAAEIGRILRREGINIITGAKVSAVGRDGDLFYAVDESSGEQVRFSAEKLLVATGRAPNSDELNIDKARVKVDERGFIKVDNNFKTSTEGIWAIGDVIGGPMFTHKAWHDGFLLANQMVDGKMINPQERLIPFAVFTDPEIAGVGLGENQAREAGYNIRVKNYPFAAHGRNIVDEKLDGFIKLIFENERNRLVGAHMIGSEAGELIHELITAMRFGATAADLQELIHIHPTLAEAINSAAM
jgi:dihydrolipoamide dehydrogenase